jgi:hypothetical protein
MPFYDHEATYDILLGLIGNTPRAREMDTL